MFPLDDTIAAIASPPGGAARGIVRLSGPRLRACLEGCFRPSPYMSLPAITRPTAVPGLLWLPGFASPAPSELYLWPGRRSYTGQPVAEIHTLGSPPLLEAVVRAACAGGARPAQPGEFTLRAFLAGRIDLTQAEAVLGVIDAADPAELRTALSQLAGGLAGPLHRLRGGLLDLLAHLEAGLDFADEDLPFITAEELGRQLAETLGEVNGLIERMDSRGEAADRLRVVLVGRPNTGKSSLFNALVRGGALVSETPGTTRDYLTAELDLDGVKCQLIDTAGIGAEPAAGTVAADSPAGIAAVAQAAARREQGRAHASILCLDSTRPLDAWEEAELAREPSTPRIVVWTKVDGAAGDTPQSPAAHARRAEAAPTAIESSSVTGLGLEPLRGALRRIVVGTGMPPGEVVAGTAIRCRQSLELSAQSLQQALELVLASGGEELVAAEVRVALDELGKISGAVYTDELLDRVFCRFCIGK